MAPKEHIVEQLNCPRCNAIAHLKAVDWGSVVGTTVDGDTDSLLLVIKCDKCKLKRVGSFTTKKALDAYRRKQHLLEKLETTEDEVLKRRIMDVVSHIDHEQNIYELGI